MRIYFENGHEIRRERLCDLFPHMKQRSIRWAVYRKNEYLGDFNLLEDARYFVGLWVNLT